MPFDTTYIIKTNDEKTTTKLIIPSVKDTTIYIAAEDLSPDLKNIPEIKNDFSTSPIKEELKSWEGLWIFFALTSFFLFIFLGDKIIGWIQNKNHFKIPKAISILLLSNTILFAFLGRIEFAFVSFILLLTALVTFRNELSFIRKTINILQSDGIEIKRKKDKLKVTTSKYYGTSLKFSNEEFHKILTKHFPYYNTLDEQEKKKFIHRTRKFILNKIFYIHTVDNFKEMPILVSASAIQLTFGIKDYLLHYFKHIHIYPEAFYRANHLGICFLEGTVTGNKISLSWKHFLGGYRLLQDGVNVGLHEFAHALYYQKAVIEFDTERGRYYDKKFYNNFSSFINNGHKAFKEETIDKILYSDYALTNFQEFWAESIEIFFEKPVALKTQYPELYGILCILLNQDTASQQISTIT